MNKILLSFFIISVFSLTVLKGSFAINQDKGFDGEIVFVRSNKKANYDQIFVLDIRTKEEVQLTNKGRNLWPKWSPDGKKIAFVSIRDNHKNYEIYLMDANGDNQRRITNTENGNSTDPRWDSSGEIIFFRSTVKGDVREKVIDLTTISEETLQSTGGVPEVKPINNIGDYIKEYLQIDKEKKKEINEEIMAERKKLERWFENRRGLFNYFPSPNGMYLILYYDFAQKIVLLDMETGNQKELNAKRAGSPAWSRGSSKIAYVDYGKEEKPLTIYDIRTDQYTEFQIVSKFDEGIASLSWGRKPIYISFHYGLIDSEDQTWICIYDTKNKLLKKLVRGHSPDWY